MSALGVRWHSLRLHGLSACKLFGRKGRPGHIRCMSWLNRPNMCLLCVKHNYVYIGVSFDSISSQSCFSYLRHNFSISMASGREFHEPGFYCSSATVFARIRSCGHLTNECVCCNAHFPQDSQLASCDHLIVIVIVIIMIIMITIVMSASAATRRGLRAWRCACPSRRRRRAPRISRGVHRNDNNDNNSNNNNNNHNNNNHHHHHRHHRCVYIYIYIYTHTCIYIYIYTDSCHAWCTDCSRGRRGTHRGFVRSYIQFEGSYLRSR